ncbi:MAG: leucine-rich repeat protein [Clostridia bacterium]|nr:leucine-rich repeat protein [Clostridia bacterium]
MGDTKETQLHLGLKLTRIVTASLAGLFFLIVLAQVVFFPSIKISFQTGADAQQVAAINIKKGTNVELPSSLKPGACFMGWSLSPNSGKILADTSGLKKNTTLYAVWDGIEKYAVLSVNGIPYKEVNIFDTSVDGLTATQLNENWRVLDDFALDNPNRAPQTISSTKTVYIDPNNNYSRFLGWQYLNNYGTYNDLLYTVDATGIAGSWTLVTRDANGNETSRSEICETNKFYPPNYRTTFTALLEYRTLDIQFYDKDANRHNRSLKVNLGETGITMPAYQNVDNPDVQFSHWEIQAGKNKNFIDATKYPELKANLGLIKTRYEAGEVIDMIDPLWYYLGNGIISLDGASDNLVVTLTVRAVYWDDESVYHYSIQPFTDLDSGTTYTNFADVSYNNLSFETPVAFEDGSIWFHYNDRILSYTFYDHKGVYHEITAAKLKANTDIGLSIGFETIYLDQTVYFNENWAITIAVNYQTSGTNVTVKFNYGSDIYSLPNCRHYEKPVVNTYTRKIGNSFVLLTGENYMKYDQIFTGWKLVGDESGRLYCAGEWFTIPNFDTSSQRAVLEFEAVWHWQRLLFSFDFMGGQWENDVEPDFTLMKGAYGNHIQIIKDVPVRFGYDFIGWTLENKSFTDESELFQPNDDIVVGTKIQTLYAQWKPRRLRVLFYTRDITDKPALIVDPVIKQPTGDRLYSGGYVKLPYVQNTNWSTFNGWQIGNNIVLANNELQLTTLVLSQLETNLAVDEDGYILEVRIYANQTKHTTNVNYDLQVVINDLESVTLNLDNSQLATVLTQGDYFYDYYPFSVAKTNGNYAAFDTNGRRFLGWSYQVAGEDLVAIDENTTVPVGKRNITVYGHLSEVKIVTVEYYDLSGYLFSKDDDVYTYGAIIPLLGRDDLDPSIIENDSWGTFVGWALEPDHESGNPEIIYDAYYNDNPLLQLANKVDTTILDSMPYFVNIDRYAVRHNENNYKLKLYAVYATDYATIIYDYLKYTNQNGTDYNNTELKFPVYSNGNYNKTALGGSTVGYDSPLFVDYGISVLDDSTLAVYSGTNFIGWKAKLSDGVNPAIKEYFENKIWFPGEYLPSVDFDVEFEPIREQCSDEVVEISVGKRVYRVLLLKKGTDNINFNGSVDIVAFPRGTYTLKRDSVVINSDREVHIVLPSNAESVITLEPMAIQCNTIKEFYVGENLLVSGTPVYGDDFQAYRVQKGYRIMDENGEPTAVLNASEKYDFASTLLGLLVSKDGKVLYGVPSHVQVTADNLLNFLVEKSIEEIKSYAFTNINNYSVINLGLNLANNQKLKIEANAIFNGIATHIILPVSSSENVGLVVSPSAIAGSQRNLRTVTFGDANNTQTWYAFVDGGFVYYVDDVARPNAKTHVMYVLPSAKLTALDYTNRNLCFANTVTKIEPYALMGRDWTQINSVMAENVAVDLSVVLGIPNNIPVFVNVDSEHKDKYNFNPMIQSYKKTYEFICYDSISGFVKESLEYSYGQTFTVFNAQKNNYHFYFDKLWSQFVGWRMNGRLFRVGEVYKVGISNALNSNKYKLTFDAQPASCWQNYPVQFYIYDGNTNVPYTPSAFYDVDGAGYSISDLLAYRHYLGRIYLPGVDQSFTKDGSTYQFIGWGTSQTNPNDFKTLLWNTIGKEYRILPNQTVNTELNTGYGSYEGIYSYYALYEKVTPNIEYELLEDNTFVAKTLTTNVTSLNIPFAKYHDGYMLPVSKIEKNFYNAVATNLTEIAIGGAVSEIGDHAFDGVNASQITFAHKGRGIYYNHRQTSAVRSLVIGKNAFAENHIITKLVLPATLKSLDDGAFRSCSSLVSVVFESGYSPSISSLGDFVFRDDLSMTDNEVVKFLIEDSKLSQRFDKVGSGIFMNTNITNVKTSDGLTTNKIVWIDKLLHVYYPSGFATDLTFDEKEIAGYAFVNAGSNTDTNQKITIRFSDSDVIIHPYAFSNLHTNVKNIYLKNGTQSSVKIENVDINAFDDTVKHTVNVYTNNRSMWIAKFQKVYNLNYFKFN